MKRLIYILSGLCLNIVALATQVNLQPSNTNWHTAMPNDTLYIKEKGQYLIKITQIGKFHFEQTTKDTVDLRIKGGKIKDHQVINGLPSADTLDITFSNLLVYNKYIWGYDGEMLKLTNDTCNINIRFKGENTLLSTASTLIQITGKTPSLNFVGKEGKTTMSTHSAHYNIMTEVSEHDNITYNLANIKRLSGQAGCYNKSGNVFLYNQQKHSTIYNGAATKLYLENSSASYSDIYYQSAPIYSKGKIYLKDCTYTNEPLGNSFIIASDTIFIDESAPGKTFLNCGIGGYRNPLGETIYSRVIVKNATYIRRLTAMADVYNANIDVLCVSPQVKDVLTHADLNVYNGRIGLLTNTNHTNPTGSYSVSYGNQVINVYGGVIGGREQSAIRLGYSFYYSGTQCQLLNDTLNLYGGKLCTGKNNPLILSYDNTVIKIRHKNNPTKYTTFHTSPSSRLWANGKYFYTEFHGDSLVNDSVHWDIGDMKHLIGVRNPAYGMRIVYKKTGNPTDSLVVTSKPGTINYFGNYLNTYDQVYIYPSYPKTIHYVHTLDETWTSKDTTYYEGFGKQSLPKVIYAGKTFKGWYTEPEGGLKVDSISYLQVGDVTLYTQWGPGQDIIIEDFNDGNGFNNMGGRWFADSEPRIDTKIISTIEKSDRDSSYAMHTINYRSFGGDMTCLLLRPTDLRPLYVDSIPTDYNNVNSVHKYKKYIECDFSSTTGVSLWHKGTGISIYILADSNGASTLNSNYHIPQHTEWTKVNIPWSAFNRQSSLNISTIIGLGWMERNTFSGDFWLDDIAFTEGDITPLESLKIDTVPNKYLYNKNPEILDIPLPNKKGKTELYLYPKFTPSDVFYQAITWSSADTSIVTIDEYGRVSAKQHGKTYIYCQSTMYPEVKDSILVGVADGGIYYNLNGVSIQNELPATYDYNTPQAIPAPQPINDFYTFHGWHTDSITGAVVDSASFHQFANLKAHTLYAEFTREIPGAAITILQNRILAVQNPYHYDALKEARYAWQYNNNPLASQSNFVEVGRPIPTGVYNVNIHIDQEMPISLARTIDNSTINNDDTNTNFTLYPNPIKAGQLAYLIGKFDHILLFDLNGMPVETTILNDGIIKAPQETGMYILKIGVKDQTYTLKLIVI
ncbi:MAG: InlB B-repeat-containing protein [Paludibacteraceae bacterium]|nr:InlB B-repeat-containing protein [Paludibacteraceae bacterium]